MKKYLLGFFAIVLAVGMSAFTSAREKSSKLDPQWYYLIVDGNDTDPDDYRPAEEGQPCDGSSLVICGVEAFEDPNNFERPNFALTHTFVKKP